VIGINRTRPPTLATANKVKGEAFFSHSAPKKAGSWLLIETNIGAYVSKINQFGESRQFGFGHDGGR
jgi:hypothetical protein